MTTSPAYEAGYQAGLNGEPDVNPYSKYQQWEDWADWGAGWRNGRRCYLAEKPVLDNAPESVVY